MRLIPRYGHLLALLATLAAPLAQASVVSGSAAALLNGNFETINVGIPGLTPDNNYVITGAANVPGWKTTASDNQIEIWEYVASRSGSVAAADGTHFAELNANMVSTLFQDVGSVAAGTLLDWKVSHRGRAGVDVMRLTITDLGIDSLFGTADDQVLFTTVFSDGNTAWGHYSGTGVAALGNLMRFSFESVSASGGSNSVGNFIDAAAFGVGVASTSNSAQAVPEPVTLLLAATALIGAALLTRRHVRPVGIE